MRLVPQRAPAAPAEVVARAGLQRAEKVLAFLHSGDTWLLGTRSAFVMVGAESVRRVPWEQVENAGWDRDQAVLLVSEVGEWGEPRPEHRFAIAPESDRQGPGRLLELMRERVTASVVLQRRVVVTGKRGLNVIGRRAPTGGQVDWFVEYDEGVDPSDPVVRELAGTALDEARAELGAEPS